MRLSARSAVGMLALGLAACGSPPDATPRLQRLSPAAFGIEGRLPHLSVVQIGDESREVLLAPEVVTIANLERLVVGRAGARIEVAIPESVRALPDAAFTASVQAAPEEGPPGMSWRSLAGWRLVRDTARPGRAVLELPPEPQPTESNVRLHALAPLPGLLESRRFDVPPGAHLELGYGVMNEPGPGGSFEVRFAATLTCADAASRRTHEERVRVDDTTRQAWHDVTTTLHGAGHGCRLSLETEGGSATGTRAVWAVPRIVVPQSAIPPVGVPPNLVVISIDTLRADRLSGYGNHRSTSPAIDARLISAGTTFTDVSTVFPLTSVAHLSLFTAVRPAVQPDGQRLAQATPLVTVAEVLRDAGYATAAFTGGGLAAATLGLGFGFDRYTEREFDVAERGVRTFGDGSAWVAERREPFFVFLHTYKVHAPYASSPRYQELFTDPTSRSHVEADADVPPGERAKLDAYDRAIREVDDQIAGFLDALDAAGLAERTLVVLLSDHGEAFGEHGVSGHGTAGHQEQLRVPLVLRGPGVPAGLRIASPVSLVDVVPTLLDLLGLPALEQSQGRSLRSAFGGEEPQHPVYFSWRARDAQGVRDGRWKLLAGDGTAQVFDLSADPAERMPRDPTQLAEFDGPALAAAQATEDERRRQALAARAGRGGGDMTPIPGRLQRALRMLGYL